MEEPGAAGEHRGAKDSVNATKGLQRRHQASVKLRKDKRNELIDKKRRQGNVEELMDAPSLPPMDEAASMDPLSYTQTSNPASIPLALLHQFAEMARSNDDRYAFHGTLMVRKLLSVEADPPICEVVATGIVPVLVHYMSRVDHPQLQFEAAWALTNIASGTMDHTHLVVDHGAVPLFIELFSSPSVDCREQGTWAIGNLAGEGAKCRDFVLQLGAMAPLLQLINGPCEKITLLRTATWALSNLCRGKPQPLLHLIAPAMPVLAGLLNHHDDEVVVDAAWAISYISDGPCDRIQLALDAGVLDRIVHLLRSSLTPMQTPAIRTIGNIVTGNDVQTQSIINAGALPPMHFLLTHPKRSIRKETCWTLSNIAAGNRQQLQAVIAANLFPQIILCTAAPEYEVKKEAVWVIANAASGGTTEQVGYLVSIGVIPPLCDLLNLYDPKIVMVALEALENILQVGEEDRAISNTPTNPIVDAVTACGGVDAIERLQSHNSSEVFQQSTNILRCYFPHLTQGGNAMPDAITDFDFVPDGGGHNDGGAGRGQFYF